MSHLKLFVDIGNIKEIEQFKSAVANVLSQIQVIINGQLEFDKNIMTETVTVNLGSLPNGYLIPHKLNKKGVKYIVVDQDGPGNVYHIPSKDTNGSICLNSTTSSYNYTLVLF